MSLHLLPEECVFKLIFPLLSSNDLANVAISSKALNLLVKKFWGMWIEENKKALSLNSRELQEAFKYYKPFSHPKRLQAFKEAGFGSLSDSDHLIKKSKELFTRDYFLFSDQLTQELAGKTAAEIKSYYFRENIIDTAHPTELKVSGIENFISMPLAICQLTDLKILTVQLKSLQSLPAAISQLTSLEKLDLNNNEFQTLCPEIGKLTQLHELNLGCNKVQYFPCEIAHLTHLAKLSLSSNELRNLPENIDKVLSLKKLHLEYNHIENFTLLSALTNLESLVIYSNRLDVFPPQILLLSNVKKLDLSYNKLEHLPPEIGKLTSLQKLHLNNNQLKELPQELYNLVKLRRLLLNRNLLETIDARINQLSLLEILDLAQNRVRSLPSEIGFLPHLQGISLQYNYLEDLPDSFLSLTDTVILPFGNPFSTLKPTLKEWLQTNKNIWFDFRLW